ncbi:MAG: hypothetical protein ABTQ27_04120 [Amaricoccus sp.]|mgnify:CR=1 FL=1|uniref:hypothetical protein n=1 Tax=Amaricoccus sp. TaxID=1872485 RepID=UPI003315DBD2
MKPDPRAEKPARRIQKRGKIQKAHRLSGRKVRGVVVVETALEVTAALGAELDPRVFSWRPQPFTIDLVSGETAATKDALLTRFRDSRERPRPYTPDHVFSVRDVGDIIVECKHTHWIRKNPDVIERILSRLPALGFRIILLTEGDLRGAYEHNVRALAPLVRHPLPGLPEIVASCERPRPFEEVRAGLSLTNNDLLGAIAQGHLSCNLRLNRITPRTLVQAARDTAYLRVPNL